MSISSTNKNNSKAALLIGIVAITIPATVAFLMFLPQTGKLGNLNVSYLPAFHALLNSLTAIALITGYLFIKAGKRDYHRVSMWCAFALSAIFLTSYVLYHYQAAPTPYGGDGLSKYVYYFILITHIVLAMVIVPLVLFSIYYGTTNQLVKHKRLSKWTFPVWLYVAITGVLVYVLISPYY